jgi:hypothetical protein
MVNRTFAFLSGAVTLIFMAGTSFAAPGVGDELSISVTNKFGDVFTNLMVVQILGDGLVLENVSGQIKVKYADLPPPVREKYEPLAAGIVEKEQTEGALTAVYFAHMQELQAEQSRQQATQQQYEQQQADSRSEKKLQYLIFRIPNQDWRLTVINLGFGPLERQADDNQYFLQGSPGSSGSKLSLFVVKPANDGTNHDDVLSYYWSKAARDPLIDARSVDIERTDKFDRVFYVAQGVPNVNFYFAFKGRWVDVHIAKWPFVKGDEKLFADFEEYLSYGE